MDWVERVGLGNQLSAILKQENVWVTYGTIGVVVLLSIVAPIIMGFWLNRKIVSLIHKIDRVAALEFDSGPHFKQWVHELSRFQRSFMMMERGLQAFSKFVPLHVVKVLLTGSMQTDTMSHQTLTILFSDIIGFSVLSERISCEQLAEVWGAAEKGTTSPGP